MQFPLSCEANDDWNPEVRINQCCDVNKIYKVNTIWFITILCDLLYLLSMIATQSATLFLSLNAWTSASYFSSFALIML